MKGQIITYLPFKKYILLIVIVILALLSFPYWYPKLNSLIQKVSSSTTGITSIAQIYDNPQDFDGKNITVQGQYYDFQNSYLSLIEWKNPTLFRTISITITDEQYNYIKSVTCVNAEPTFKATGLIKVIYTTSQFTKYATNVVMPSADSIVAMCGNDQVVQNTTTNTNPTTRVV